MLMTGDIVEVNGKKAIVLASDETEVLVYLGHNSVRWVDRESISEVRIA